MGEHIHVKLADVGIFGLVWVIVNLMVGWIELISSTNLFRVWIDPVYCMKISSTKQVMNFSGMVPFSIYFFLQFSTLCGQSCYPYIYWHNVVQALTPC